MPKWPLLVVTLLACSGEGDELEAPMLGDCTSCTTAPSPSNGIGGGDGDGGGGLDAPFDGDAFDFDASTAPDELAIVDVGVPSDLDAFLNP